MFELTVLGSGCCLPGPRGPAGLLVRTEAGAFLLDAGGGTTWRAAAQGVSPDRIAGAIISHFHPDHASDLPALLEALFVLGLRGLERGRLTIAGPVGTADHVEGLARLWGNAVQPRSGVATRDLTPGDSVELAGVRCTALAADHGMPALCLRLERGDRAVAYSGDTAFCPGLVAAARDVDLLVAECSGTEHVVVPIHLGPLEAARAAREAGARRLLLTHLYPESDASDLERVVGRVWNGEVRRAADGLTFDVEAGRYR